MNYTNPIQFNLELLDITLGRLADYLVDEDLYEGKIAEEMEKLMSQSEIVDKVIQEKMGELT